jgi:hypothetical protein
MMGMPLRTDADGAGGAQGQPPPLLPPSFAAFQFNAVMFLHLQALNCTVLAGLEK